jgi:hypothetical protein
MAPPQAPRRTASTKNGRSHLPLHLSQRVATSIISSPVELFISGPWHASPRWSKIPSMVASRSSSPDQSRAGDRIKSHPDGRVVHARCARGPRIRSADMAGRVSSRSHGDPAFPGSTARRPLKKWVSRQELKSATAWEPFYGPPSCVRGKSVSGKRGSSSWLRLFQGSSSVVSRKFGSSLASGWACVGSRDSQGRCWLYLPRIGWRHARSDAASCQRICDSGH